MDLCIVRGVLDKGGEDVLVSPIAIMELVLDVDGVKESAVHVVVDVP